MGVHEGHAYEGHFHGGGEGCWTVLRAQKTASVEKIRAVVKDYALTVVVAHHGLSVAEMESLRARLGEEGGRFRVVKNRLMRHALSGLPQEGLVDFLEGPSALACSEDATTAARVAASFARETDKLTLRGGFHEGILLSASEVMTLASLPPLAQLRAGLVACLQEQAARLARLVATPQTELARLCAAYGRSA